MTNRLKREREKRGWTRAELARRAAMSAGDVGKIESARVVPYESQLKKLARALGIKAGDSSTLLTPEGNDD
jgi:ribosome-binding protein aMBF1 (putative translation factor)